MCFASHVESSRKNDLIWLVTGQDQGRPCWYYVLVEKLKLELFKAKLRTDFINMTEFGEILHSGWGDEPPASIRRLVLEGE